jgi:hypothetical protein
MDTISESQIRFGAGVSTSQQKQYRITCMQWTARQLGIG